MLKWKLPMSYGLASCNRLAVPIKSICDLNLESNLFDKKYLRLRFSPKLTPKVAWKNKYFRVRWIILHGLIYSEYKAGFNCRPSIVSSYKITYLNSRAEDCNSFKTYGNIPTESARLTAHGPKSRKRPRRSKARKRCAWLRSTWSTIGSYTNTEYMAYL